MSTDSASQGPLPSTLGEVAAVIQARGDLQDWVRRDLGSAIRTVCRALGQAPADVPADPILLRRRLTNLSAPAVGLSGGSWRNAKSRLNKAMAMAGITTVSGRAKASLMPGWKELFAGAPDSRRYKLSLLAGVCTGRGVGPAAVDDRRRADLGDAAGKGGLIGRVKAVYREACKAWNEWAGAVAAWWRLIVAGLKVLASRPATQTLRI